MSQSRPTAALSSSAINRLGDKTDTTVARFTSSGQPDTTFPSSTHTGNVSFDVGNGLNEAPHALGLDSVGRIVVTGNVSTNPLANYVLRLSSTGAVDATFGSNGVFQGTFGGTTATSGGLAVDSSGRLLVAGGDGPSVRSALGIERLLPTGAVPYDAAFGLTATPGRETITCGTGTGLAKAVALQANQQIVLAGNCDGALKIARLNPGNISNLTMTATSPTAAAGHQVIPLSSIPAGVLLGFAGAFAGSDLHDSALFGARRSTRRSTARSIRRSTVRSTGRSIRRSTVRSTVRSIRRSCSRRRCRAFRCWRR